MPFPGIGYTCDKPLLYYSRNLLQKMGWEVVCVPYSGFPAGVKGNTVKQEQCVAMAAEQAEAMLKKIRWSRYDDILFVGKSVGTVVGPAYAKAHGIDCRQVLFTPVEDTFPMSVRKPLPSTARRIPGRIRTPSGTTAAGWAFRCMKVRTPIIPWKPGMWGGTSGSWERSCGWCGISRREKKDKGDSKRYSGSVRLRLSE